MKYLLLLLLATSIVFSEEIQPDIVKIEDEYAAKVFYYHHYPNIKGAMLEIKIERMTKTKIEILLGRKLEQKDLDEYEIKKLFIIVVQTYTI